LMEIEPVRSGGDVGLGLGLSNTVSGVRMISASLLKSLRSEYYLDVIDKGAWKKGGLFLPPHRIIRAYQLEEAPLTPPPPPPASTSTSSSRAVVEGEVNTKLTQQQQLRLVMDKTWWQSPIICEPRNTSEYCHIMAHLREVSQTTKWELVYHYTQPLFASLILKTGFKMSTQGQVPEIYMLFLTYFLFLCGCLMCFVDM
jgi:hypothetical protein